MLDPQQLPTNRFVQRMFWEMNLHEYVQIGVSLTIAVVALLTYFLAKRTVFDPLRTEKFKVQLASMTHVSQLFSAKTEYDLQEWFGLRDAITMNYEYLVRVLEAPWQVEYPEPPGTRHTYINSPADTDPETALSQLTGDRHTRLFLPESYVTARTKLEQTCGDPLLPAELVRRLKLFLDGIDDCISALGRSMEAVAAGVKQGSLDVSRYTLESTWIGEAPNLAEPGDSIVQFIREYFDPDALASHGGRRRTP